MTRTERNRARLTAVFLTVSIWASAAAVEGADEGSRPEECERWLARLASKFDDLASFEGSGPEQLDVRTRLAEQCLGATLEAKLRARVFLAVRTLPAYQDPGLQARLAEELLAELRVDTPPAPEQIRLLEALSESYFRLQSFDLALRTAEASLAVRRSLFGDSSEQAVDGLILVAFEHLAEWPILGGDSLTKARNLVDQAVTLASKEFGESSPPAVRAWSALAEVLRQAGDEREADRIFWKYVDGRERALDASLPGER